MKKSSYFQKKKSLKNDKNCLKNQFFSLNQPFCYFSLGKNYLISSDLVKEQNFEIIKICKKKKLESFFI